MYLSTELIEGKLWAGSRHAVENGQHFRGLLEKGMVCTVSILPIGSPGAWPLESSFRYKPPAMRVLIMGDHEEIPPTLIDHAVSMDAPTLIHCNVGQNRSTAIAACWLLKHGHYDDDEIAWQYVVGRRTRDIGASPRVSKEMRQNVATYREWLDSFSPLEEKEHG